MTAAFAWSHALAVAGGAAVGGVLRWRVGVWLSSPGHSIVLGTLAVNCVGGLLAGVALVWFDRAPHEVLRLLVVTGFLGGLTTFSAFTSESLLLLQRGEWATAIAHSAAHLLGALGAALIGFKLFKALLA